MRSIFITFLVFGFSYITYSQDVIHKVAAKKIELLMSSPVPIPQISPVKKSFNRTGYKLTLRTRYYQPFWEIPSIVRKRKLNEHSAKDRVLPILMIYCEISYGFLKKRDHIELFDDCTFRLNGKRYENDNDLFRNILNLMPLGLREYWQRYYACFEDIKID